MKNDFCSLGRAGQGPSPPPPPPLHSSSSSAYIAPPFLIQVALPSYHQGKEKAPSRGLMPRWSPFEDRGPPPPSF